jgi:hypothetical protein
MQMNKTKAKLRTLTLNKETILTLTADQLKAVNGGNTSGRPSQCATECTL